MVRPFSSWPFLSLKYLVASVAMILLFTTLLIVDAQHTVRVSPRCNAQAVEVDYVYKVHSLEGYTNYLVVLTAGRCTREFRGRVGQVVNVAPFIEAQINARVANQNMSFYPDPFGEIDIDGRGFYALP